jgi:hypothetical protein
VLLRWAKEDLYVTPAACIAIALAVARSPAEGARRALALAAVAGAMILRIRDYGFHADTLRFLR